MKIKELLAATRGGAQSSELTPEQAQGRRTLFKIAAGVWVPLIVNTLATGRSAESVWLSAAGAVATVGLVLGWPWARHVTSWVLTFGGVAAIVGAVAHPWPVRLWYILTFISWGSAAATLENSDAIDAYVERDE